jgi:hypothetical protein
MLAGVSSPSGEALSATFSAADLTVTLSPAEGAAGTMPPAKAATVAALFRAHGCVVLTCDVPLIPLADLDLMRARLNFQAALAMASGLLAGPTEHGGSGARRRPGISTKVAGIHAGSLPRRAPWVRPSVVANPIVEQTVAACFGGQGCFLNTFGLITNYPASGTQVLCSSCP